jgi:hypothetical protein
MGTIYEIVGDVRSLEALTESLTDEETGETREITDEERATFLSWIKEQSDAFDTKFDNICKYYRNIQATAAVATAERDAMKAEMDRLSKRAKAREAEATRIKGLIWYAFDALNMKKHKTALFSAGIQATAASVKTDSLFDPDTVPEFLLKKRELSPSAVEDGVKDGKLYKKPVSDDPKEISEGIAVSALDANSLFYKVQIEEPILVQYIEKKLEHVIYAPGKTLVVR